MFSLSTSKSRPFCLVKFLGTIIKSPDSGGRIPAISIVEPETCAEVGVLKLNPDKRLGSIMPGFNPNVPFSLLSKYLYCPSTFSNRSINAPFSFLNLEGTKTWAFWNLTSPSTVLLLTPWSSFPFQLSKNTILDWSIPSRFSLNLNPFSDPTTKEFPGILWFISLLVTIAFKRDSYLLLLLANHSGTLNS